MTGLLNRVIGSYGSVDAGHEEIPFTLQEPYHFEEASIFMRLTFEWLSPLFTFGNVKGRLDMDDLRKWHLPIDDSTDIVVEQFRSSWKKENQKAHFNNMKPNLARALWNAYYLDFCKAGILKLIHDMFQFVAPQVLKALIVYLRSPAESIWYGISLTLIIAVAQIIMSISLRQYYFTCYRVGLRIRTAMVTAIYTKALSIQSCQKSTGQITNLMSIDVQHLQDIVTSLHSLWYSVFQIVVSLIFLYQQMGVSIFAGVLVIILSIPLTAISASYMGWRQKSLMIAKDNRLEVNNEVIGNMKVVKLQAWEEPFMKKIVGLRKEELRQLWFYLIGRMFTYLTFAIVPLAISLATFSAYIFLGNRLDVASALTSLALFEILRFPLFMLPQTINGMVEAHIALNRINKFLVGPEHKAIKSDSFGSKGIRMLRATFLFDDTSPEVEEDDDTDQKIADTEWKVTLLQEQINDAEGRLALAEGRDFNIPSSPIFALSRINLSVKEGELIAVIGGVGSGKSSLLKALMGNLSQFSGELEIKGKISYAAQATFIMNASIKENILFGNSIYNHELYHRALDVCCLEHDLKLLTSGDETEIGEKGINLSGGQKARIGMARALYHNADIFLLDDPLAAVDAHVGKKLFEECIVGSMLKPSGNSSQRTVVLVTNALQYLSHPFVDRIIVLHEGNLVEAGTFKELNQKEESHFKRHLNAFNDTKSGHSHQGRSSEAFDIDFVEKKEELAIHLRNSERDTQSISNVTPLMTDEDQERETGSVSLSVYLMWAEAAGGRWTIGVIAFIFSLGEASKLLSNWWLTYWSANADGDMQSQMYYLVIYALINVTAISCSIAESVSILLIALRASRKLFTRVLDAILRCPLSFFDTTPLGRIMNRFSKDMYTVDESLPDTLETYLFCLFEVMSTLFVVSAVTPIFTLFLFPIIFIYYKQQNYFTKSYRDLKRLDSVLRSPIIALFGETLDGVTTIRAFEAESSFMSRMMKMLDDQQHAYFLTLAAQSWLGVRLELLGTGIILVACLAAILDHDAERGNQYFAGLAGLSISYAISVTQSVNWTVRVGSDLEANMVCVERLVEYCSLESEASAHTDYDTKVSKLWPGKGDIEFQNVKLRYRPGLPLVLNDLTLKIPAQSKVGIVGRTGAGKSTLMVAIMRLVEIESGKIYVDGADLSNLGLHQLRSRIAVIPQDPVLFSGTVRTNLDPFHEYSDVTLIQILERVGLMDQRNLKSPISSLNDKVSEGGSNLSFGQRQLLVIGRALLTKASLIICDEATAAVDAETDARIQKIFRSDFAKATCLTVAHRLNTIMDSDFILVMQDGKAVEFDSPENLLQRKEGNFKDLITTWEDERM